MSKDISDTAGRGRKLCPGCNKYPGVRSKTCPGCGHDFEAKKSVGIKIKVRATPEPVASEDKVIVAEVKTVKTSSQTCNSSDSVITTPSGLPPVKLLGVSIPEVKKWMDDTRASYPDEQLTYEALSYWVRYFYPTFIRNEEGQVVRDNTGDTIREIIHNLEGV